MSGTSERDCGRVGQPRWLTQPVRTAGRVNADTAALGGCGSNSDPNTKKAMGEEYGDFAP